MLVGKIVRFDQVRGYGFIAPDTGGEDVFVHANDLDVDEHTVTVGTRAEFQVVEGERGPKAYDVRVIEGAPVAGPGNGDGRAGAVDGVAPKQLANPSDDDDEWDVLSESEFRGEVTELLLRAAPTLTGAQLVDVRKALRDLARSHGWID